MSSQRFAESVHARIDISCDIQGSNRFLVARVKFQFTEGGNRFRAKMLRRLLKLFKPPEVRSIKQQRHNVLYIETNYQLSESQAVNEYNLQKLRGCVIRFLGTTIAAHNLYYRRKKVTDQMLRDLHDTSPRKATRKRLSHSQRRRQKIAS